jgi:hypothetical protein
VRLAAHALAQLQEHTVSTKIFRLQICYGSVIALAGCIINLRGNVEKIYETD